MKLKWNRNKTKSLPSKEEIAAADKWTEEQLASIDDALTTFDEFESTLAELNAVNLICLAFITHKGLEQEFDVFCSTEAKEALDELVKLHERGAAVNVP